MWGLSHVKVERGVSHGGIDCVHDLKANAGQGSYPTCLVALHMVSQTLVDCFVHALTATICRGVVS